MPQYDIIILGAGAAGCFAAIRCKELDPRLRVLILEKSARTLDKVRISGGGRCNVTNSCRDPRLLVRHYPRGERELLGPFMKWGPEEMIDWLSGHGVALKTEPDGRMFPTTDSSSTIVDLFLGLIRALEIQLLTQAIAPTIVSTEDGFILRSGTEEYQSKKLLIATGSSKTVWDQLAALGHTVIPPVPSLFAFNSKDTLLTGLPGITLLDAGISIPVLKVKEHGPVLITHNGLSGPGILRISAWRARELAELDYRFTLVVDLLPDVSAEEITARLEHLRTTQPKARLSNLKPFPLPARLWERICQMAEAEETYMSDLSKKQRARLTEILKQSIIAIDGKSTNKEEFVTAGGVSLRQVDFRTMESKIIPGLHFAGEVLDIDAITGGFNFQAAWTTAELAARAMVQISA